MCIRDREYTIQITADPGTKVGWYFWANNTLSASNQTDIQTFEVQNITTSLSVYVEEEVYPQGLETGLGYDVYIPVQARYYSSEPIAEATCYLTNDLTEESLLMSYNSSTGNYTAELSTAWLYNNVTLTVNCHKANHDSAMNSTTTKVWLYLYLWEIMELPYSTNLTDSTWLRKNPTQGPLVNMTLQNEVGEGDNWIRSFYLYGPGMNGSMERSFNVYDEHTIRLNVSVNDTTCQPVICSKIANFDLDKLIEKFRKKKKVVKAEEKKARKYFIQQLKSNGYSVTEISKMLNLSRKAIYNILQ